MTRSLPTVLRTSAGWRSSDLLSSTNSTYSSYRNGIVDSVPHSRRLPLLVAISPG